MSGIQWHPLTFIKLHGPAAHRSLHLGHWRTPTAAAAVDRGDRGDHGDHGDRGDRDGDRHLVNGPLSNLLQMHLDVS